MKSAKLLTVTALATGISLSAFVDSAEAILIRFTRRPNTPDIFISIDADKQLFIYSYNENDELLEGVTINPEQFEELTMLREVELQATAENFNRDILDEIDSILSGSTLNITRTSDDFFQYSTGVLETFGDLIVEDNELTDFRTFSLQYDFIIPANFTYVTSEGIVQPVELDLTSGLEEFLSIPGVFNDLPTKEIIDDSPDFLTLEEVAGFGGGIIVTNPPKTTPEPGNLIGFLALGALGIGTMVKRSINK